MRLALIVTTYERPDALATVLASIATQSSLPDELIVADDGSGPATDAVLDAASALLQPVLTRVRQPHQGFRLTRLRNLAIAACRSDYLVFIDGDMLLHPAFIADHRRCAAPGCFVQGVRIPLDLAGTERMLRHAGQRPGGHDLRGAGLRRLYGWHSPRLQRIARRIGNGMIAIKGCNQGFWREDLVRTNGFDEAIEGWGPEDKELCARLRHSGVERRTLLGGGIAWHLWHPAAARDRRRENQAILQRTLQRRRVRCDRGLDAHAVL